jgi:tetratricopeptide (TPR) repeat protein
MMLPAIAVALAALAVPPQEAPPLPTTPAPAEEPAAAPTPAPTGASAPAIEEGLAAFKRRRFGAAQAAFQRAVEAEPESAAANWYLAYTTYKIAEPKRPFHPDKQKAATLFARAYELDPTFRPAWSMR